MAITVSPEDVMMVNKILQASGEREENLRKSLVVYMERQTELLRDIKNGKEREKRLQQKCTSLEAKAQQWESLFNEAVTSYAEVEAWITAMEKERAEAEQAMVVQVKSLHNALAAMRVEGHEELAFSPKDLQIQTLQSQLAEIETNQVKWGAEMEYEANASSEQTIEVLKDVSERVLALVVKVEESQPGHKYGCTATSMQYKRQDVPEHLRCSPLETSKFKCLENIRYAQAALVDATKSWKKAQDGAWAMLELGRKDILNTIVGRNG